MNQRVRVHDLVRMLPEQGRGAADGGWSATEFDRWPDESARRNRLQVSCGAFEISCHGHRKGESEDKCERE